MLNSKDVAVYCAAAADDKRARDIVLLDLAGVSIVADYFLICSGSSATQVKAVADAVIEKMETEGISLLRREGHHEGKWILLDYGGVVVHIFQEEIRNYYDLERLWGDAPKVNYPFTSTSR